MSCHDEAHIVYKSEVSHFSKKISFWGKQAIWDKSGPKFATFYLMIVCKDCLKHFIMMKHKMCTKVTLLNFT